jgi:hypothetical protein
MWFKFNNVPSSFINKAPWIFRSEVELDILVQDCWNIILNDKAWRHWHPEVTDIKWMDEGKHQKSSERTIIFKDLFFMILLLGPVKLYEHFDIWEDDDNYSTKCFGFYVNAATRPSWLTYKALREEFKVEPIGDKTNLNINRCKFTRTVAIWPSFLIRYILGWIVHPRLSYLFEKAYPERLIKALQEKKFTF